MDSRPVEDNNSIKVGVCVISAESVFTTYEKVESIPLSVIKKDQTKNESMMNRSFRQVCFITYCYKGQSIVKIEEMIDSVEGAVFNMEEREIASGILKGGEIVMEHLRIWMQCICQVHLCTKFKDVSTFIWMN